MKSLRTRFSLALSIVLLAATGLPILALYLLSASGLIEARYETAVQSDQDSRVIDFSFGELPSRDEPESISRVPIEEFPPGDTTQRIPFEAQRISVASPVFHFRIEMPASIAIGVMAFLSLFTGLVISYWMSRSVTKPVSELANAAKAIGEHDLGYRVEAGGSQELADLAQSFNQMAEDLERSEVARKNLMADVSHELRTPLAVLEGNLRAFLDGIRNPDEEEIALLYEQTHHLNKLVNDLRELSLAEAKQFPLEVGECDLGELIDETVSIFRIGAEQENLQITAQLEGDLCHPSLDAHRIRQVLHNLLSNAVRHSHEGGNITVSATRVEKENLLEMVVADDGEGIREEDLAYIFDRFYRAEKSRGKDAGGAGLGLAIVKAIVEAHGGTVIAYSAGMGEGSEFRVRLPI